MGLENLKSIFTEGIKKFRDDKMPIELEHVAENKFPEGIGGIFNSKINYSNSFSTINTPLGYLDSPDGNDIIIKDEWGRAQKIKATKGNLEMIKGWSEER